MENHNDERQSVTEPMDHMERTEVAPRKELDSPKVISAGTDMGVKQPSFQVELEWLINRHSKENGSDTPDFILVEYLIRSLDLFDVIVRRRDQWYRSCDEYRTIFGVRKETP